ncbi:hypothetical protein [Fluviicola sp.]|uniref:hypothetical protein n=1 Tax=Fluviicola sp. TaxID=1917219 RepID=UPI00262666C4|nr:hypothetical protein [Fluviicola sp.]
MRITIKSVLLLAIIFSGLSACTKEKKLERSLLKKEGVWDVVNVHNMYYSYDSLINESNSTDHTAFVFQKGGKFSWENGNDTGTWFNTDNEIVITLVNQWSYNNNNVLIFRVIEESKNEMTLEYAKLTVDMGVWKSVTTYRIKRRK